MCNSFQLAGLERPVTSTSTHTTQTNWKLCIISQEDKSESLTFPSKSKRKDSGSGYSSFAANLSRFSELGQLPGTLQLERLNEERDNEAAMVTNNANTKLQRAEKRTFMTEGEINDAPGAHAPDFIQDNPVQRRNNKPSVSSADNLLEPMGVFTKLQHFKWTVKFETEQPFLKTRNCSADSVLGTWSPRTPSTIRSAYDRCCTSVLEGRV